MSNYEKFKRIINPHLTTVRVARSREEGSCFSSLFSSCCGSDSSPEQSNEDRLNKNQRAFITGINYIAEKLNRGEVIYPEDFAGNVQTYDQATVSEEEPLLRSKDTRRSAVSRTKPSGQPLIDFIPSFEVSQREGAFNLYLNAIYQYLHNLYSVENEGDFSNQLMTAFEHAFGEFVVREDLQGQELLFKNFITNSIKKTIPLQTRHDDINALRSTVRQISGLGDKSGESSDSPPRKEEGSPVALTSPPTLVPSGEPEIGSPSYDSSYTGAKRPAKK